MIFKRIFRPKHQDPNPNVRLAAIAKLDKDTPLQKTILHELAFNDADVNVSLAALSRLDSFALWYKMAGISKNERVTKTAWQRVEQVLFSDANEPMSLAQKRLFAAECKDPRVLEKLLTLAWLQEEPKLVEQILNDLAKPHLALATLLGSKNEALQLSLLKFANSQVALQKVIKKVDSEKVKIQAQAKLTSLQVNKTQPILVEKQTRLLLSRLLALKDSQDYLKLNSSRDALLTEYAGLESQFPCLSLSRQQEFSRKFSDINNKLCALLVDLAPLWQAEQLKLEMTQRVEHVGVDTEAVLVWLADMLAGDIAQITLAQTEQAQTEIQARALRIQELIAELPVKHDGQQNLQRLQRELIQRQHTFNHLPAFQQALIQARGLLTELQLLVMPTETIALQKALERVEELKREWKILRSTFLATWPRALQEDWTNQLACWLHAKKTLKISLVQELNRCRSKIKAAQVFIEQGKYKAAMGIYAKAEQYYLTLPSSQQTQLSRIFEKLTAEINDLKDLQAYIIQPRKPALLVQVIELIEQPLPVDEQANKIKELRQSWNSLGKLDTEEDAQLNTSFDEKLEQAFAPCRQHYEQQQQKRVTNYAAKSAIIAELTNLAGQACSAAELAIRLRQLQQKWQNVGEVDHQLRDAINAEYQQALSAPNARIVQYYQHNAEYKQSLIDQAQKLLEAQDMLESVELAKELQRKWKDAEPAGRRLEQQLWTTFRQLNDQIFAKRKALNQQQKQQVELQIDALQLLLNNMQNAINSAETTSQLKTLNDAKAEFYDQLNKLPVKMQARLDTQCKAIMDTQQAKLRALAVRQENQQFVDLFNVLRQWKVAALPELSNQLANAWQQAFKSSATEDGIGRHDITLMLELVCERVSPQADQAKRKDIQLRLMADKLQTGLQVDKLSLLKQWIGYGPVLEQDLGLLTRTERCFIEH